jgi:hypothetical protein
MLTRALPRGCSCPPMYARMLPTPGGLCAASALPLTLLLDRGATTLNVHSHLFRESDQEAAEILGRLDAPT